MKIPETMVERLRDRWRKRAGSEGGGRQGAKLQAELDRMWEAWVACWNSYLPQDPPAPSAKAWPVVVVSSLIMFLSCESASLACLMIAVLQDLAEGVQAELSWWSGILREEVGGSWPFTAACWHRRREQGLAASGGGAGRSRSAEDGRHPPGGAGVAARGQAGEKLWVEGMLQGRAQGAAIRSKREHPLHAPESMSVPFLMHGWDLQSGRWARSLLQSHQVCHATLSPERPPKVITSSLDGSIMVWSSRTGELLCVLEGHAAGVNACQFSPGGEQLASCSADGSVLLWSARTFRQQHRLKAGEDSDVQSCAYSSDGALLAGGDQQGWVYVWSTALQDLQLSVRPFYTHVSSVAFSAQAAYLAAVTPASKGQHVAVVDVNAGQVMYTLGDGAAGPHGASMHPMAAAFFEAGGSCQLLTPSFVEPRKPVQLVLWDVASGAVLRRLTCELGLEGAMPAEAWVHCNVSPGAEWVVSCSKNRAVLWQIVELGEELEVQGRELAIPQDMAGSLGEVHFSGCGRFVAIAGDSAIAVLQCCDSGDGPRSLTAPAADAPPTAPLGRWALHPLVKDRGADKVIGLAFGQGNSREASLAAWTRRGTASFWDLQGGRLCHRFGGCSPTTCCSSADGRALALGTCSGAVLLLDAVTGAVSARCESSSSSAVTALCFAPDGRHLAVAHEGEGSNEQCAVAVLRVADGCEVQVKSGSGGASVREVAEWHAVGSLCFSHDSRTLAAGVVEKLAGSFKVFVWEVESGNELFRASGVHVTHLSFSPADTHLLAVALDGTARRSGPTAKQSMAGIAVWEVQSGKLCGQLSLGCGRISSSSFAADGSQLLVGMDDGRALTCRLSETTLPQLKAALAAAAKSARAGRGAEPLAAWKAVKMQALLGHAAAVRRICLSTQGRLAASCCSQGNAIVLWSTATGDQLHLLRPPCHVAGGHDVVPDDGATPRGADRALMSSHAVLPLTGRDRGGGSVASAPALARPQSQPNLAVGGAAVGIGTSGGLASFDPAEVAGFRRWTACCVSPCSRIVAAGCADGSVAVYDCCSSHLLWAACAPGGAAIVDLTFLGPSRLVTQQENSQVLLWDLTPPMLPPRYCNTRIKSEWYNPAYAADTFLAWECADDAAAFSCAGHRLVWADRAAAPLVCSFADTATPGGEAVHPSTVSGSLEARPPQVLRDHMVALRPDCHVAANGGPRYSPLKKRGSSGAASSPHDGTRLVQAQISLNGERVVLLQCRVERRRLAADSIEVAVPVAQGRLTVWQASSGRLIQSISPRQGFHLAACAISTGGDKVAAAVGPSVDVIVWDATTGVPQVVIKSAHLATVHPQGEHSYSCPAVVSLMAFSKDGGQLLTGAAFDDVVLWDVGTESATPGSRLVSLGTLQAPTSACDITGQGDKVLYCRTRQTLAVHSTADGALVQQMVVGENITQCTFSCDGRLVVAAIRDVSRDLNVGFEDYYILPDRGWIGVWDISQGLQVCKLRTHRLTAMCISVDMKSVLIVNSFGKKDGVPNLIAAGVETAACGGTVSDQVLQLLEEEALSRLSAHHVVGHQLPAAALCKEAHLRKRFPDEATLERSPATAVVPDADGCTLLEYALHRGDLDMVANIFHYCRSLSWSLPLSSQGRSLMLWAAEQWSTALTDHLLATRGGAAGLPPGLFDEEGDAGRPEVQPLQGRPPLIAPDSWCDVLAALPMMLERSPQAVTRLLESDEMMRRVEVDLRLPSWLQAYDMVAVTVSGLYGLEHGVLGSQLCQDGLQQLFVTRKTASKLSMAMRGSGTVSQVGTGGLRRHAPVVGSNSNLQQPPAPSRAEQPAPPLQPQQPEAVSEAGYPLVECEVVACMMPEVHSSKLLQILVNDGGRSEHFDTDVVKAIIDYKWRMYGQTEVLMSALIYSVLLLSHSIYCLGLAEEAHISQIAGQDAACGSLGSRAVKLGSLAAAVLMAMHHLHMEWRQLRHVGLRAWVSSVWNMMELVGYLMVLLLAPLHLTLQGASRGMLRLAAGLTCVLLWARLVYYARPFKSTGPLVQMVLQIVQDILSFLLLLAVINIGFAIGFLVLFADQVEMEENADLQQAFGSMARALLSGFDMMMGNSEMSLFMKASSPVVAIAMYVLYMMIMLVVLFNLLIAIMGDSFARIKHSEGVEFLKARAAILVDCKAGMSCVTARSIAQRAKRWLVLIRPCISDHSAIHPFPPGVALATWPFRSSAPPLAPMSAAAAAEPAPGGQFERAAGALAQQVAVLERSINAMRAQLGQLKARMDTLAPGGTPTASERSGGTADAAGSAGAGGVAEVLGRMRRRVAVRLASHGSRPDARLGRLMSAALAPVDRPVPSVATPERLCVPQQEVATPSSSSTPQRDAGSDTIPAGWPSPSSPLVAEPEGTNAGAVPGCYSTADSRPHLTRRRHAEGNGTDLSL